MNKGTICFCDKRGGNAEAVNPFWVPETFDSAVARLNAHDDCNFFGTVRAVKPSDNLNGPDAVTDSGSGYFFNFFKWQELPETISDIVATLPAVEGVDVAELNAFEGNAAAELMISADTKSGLYLAGRVYDVAQRRLEAAGFTVDAGCDGANESECGPFFYTMVISK